MSGTSQTQQLLLRQKETDLTVRLDSQAKKHMSMK